MSRLVRLSLGLFACCYASIIGATPAVHLYSGPSDARVDIAVLGDGFTVAEEDDFYEAAAELVDAMLTQYPFSAYQAHYNARLLFTASAESGADHPSQGIDRDTAFGATYECSGITRLICVDYGLVNPVLTANFGPDEHDIVLILVNDEQYGGSGGSYAVSSINQAAAEIAIHEIGHSFGGLADEYEASQATCDIYGGGVLGPNVDDQTARNLIRWNTGGGPPQGWIELLRPLPSVDTQASTPGLYDGGGLCPKGAGLYRPTFNSKMRSLNQPFDQINSEELIKRTYQDSGVIEDLAGGASKIAVDATQAFLQVELVGELPTYAYDWKINGLTAATAAELDTTLLPAVSEVSVTVSDASGAVRYDPNGDSTETASLLVAAGELREIEPNNLLEQAQSLLPGQSIAGTLAGSPGGPSGELQLASPENQQSAVKSAAATAEDDADYLRFFTQASGQVTLRAAAMAIGSAVTSVEIRNDQGQLIASAQVTSPLLDIVYDDVLPAGDYSVEIGATGEAAYVMDVSLAEPALPPQSLQILETSVGDGEISIQVAATNDGGRPVLEFTVECSGGGQDFVAYSASPSITLTGLENGVSYACTVRARNVVGEGPAAAVSGSLAPVYIRRGIPLWLLKSAAK